MHKARLASASAFSLFAFFACTFIVSAQENRQYWYDSIDTRITVNQDSTLSVEERQTYRYEGEYHQGWRSIALKDISYISDIEVYDGAVGKKLEWSSSKLDKTDSKSWGRYTTYKENGSQIIEWYYNLRDASHLWILRYKVHGAIIFGTQFDRLYYNLFTDYSVPVNSASANIALPKGLSSEQSLYAYRSEESGSLINKFVTREGEKDIYTATGVNFSERQDFTIDLSWQKGYVSQSAFWRDWFGQYYGFVLGGIIVLSSLLYWVVYYIRTEVLPKGRGTIIPQYEPPRGLRPALAELVVTERISRRTWPATIIDLAVRGYVDIEEKEKGWFPFSSTAYEVRGKRDYAADAELESYEKSFLKTLFSLNDENVFRTKDLTEVHFNMKKYVQFGEEMRKLPTLLQDRADEESWYEVNFKKERKGHLVGLLIFIVAIFLFFSSGFQQIFVLIASLAVLYSIVGFFAPSEARLSQKGRELREEWLGFKLYLETAERYRLQNLTPDLFEKFLPYAMMFGIEKKWAKAFEGMHVAPPSWYHGALVAGSMGDGAPGAGFSASAFSSSFSSSFASAFSSSAGSGASGGGGAGGGGGGGGGGAG